MLMLGDGFATSTIAILVIVISRPSTQQPITAAVKTTMGTNMGIVIMVSPRFRWRWPKPSPLPMMNAEPTFAIVYFLPMKGAVKAITIARVMYITANATGAVDSTGAMYTPPMTGPASESRQPLTSMIMIPTDMLSVRELAIISNGRTVPSAWGLLLAESSPSRKIFVVVRTTLTVIGRLMTRTGVELRPSVESTITI